MGGNGEGVYETCCREREREREQCRDVKLGKQRGTFTSDLFSPSPSTHLHIYSSPSELTAHLGGFQGNDSLKEEPQNKNAII